MIKKHLVRSHANINVTSNKMLSNLNSFLGSGFSLNVTTYLYHESSNLTDMYNLLEMVTNVT